MALVIGEVKTLTGDVTQLKAIGAKAPAGVEEMLGYGAGRLARGYWICLLSGMLTPGEFEFGGNTLRSGGKLGLPATTPESDARRSRVHSQILYEYGEAGYGQLQSAALRNVTPIGANRIVKVVPVIGHIDEVAPAEQYPMGGGALQWRLVPPGKPFFVAAFVDARGEARTPTFSTSVAAAARYDDRAKLARYLAEVPA